MDETVLTPEETALPAPETPETPHPDSLRPDDVTGTQDATAPHAGDETDYAAVERADLDTLRLLFPEMEHADSLGVLSDPVRYGQLRDMGLSPKEAYLAVGKRQTVRADNRTHLHSAVPKASVAAPGDISEGELNTARDLFGDLSDAQIRSLYRKVNKSY